MNDKLEQIYKLYLDNGLLTEATPFATFSNASDTQRQQLFSLGQENGLFVTTTIDQFNTAWGGQSKTIQEENIPESVMQNRESQDPIRQEFNTLVKENKLPKDVNNFDQFKSFKDNSFERLTTLPNIYEGVKYTPTKPETQVVEEVQEEIVPQGPVSDRFQEFTPPAIEIEKVQGEVMQLETRAKDIIEGLATERNEEQLKTQELFTESNKKVQGDAQFKFDLESVKNIKELNEDDAAKFLNKKFNKYGVTFTPRQGDGSNSVIAVSPRGAYGVTQEEIVLGENAIEDVERFINFNALEKTSGDLSEDQLAKDLKAQRLRPLGGLINEDGTVSTVKFMSFEEDGKYKVAPTLFPKNPEFYNSDASTWTDLGENMDEAIKLAYDRGEVFTFDTKEAAEAFAKGSWKSSTPAVNFARKFYEENGRSYDAWKYQQDMYDAIKNEINYYEGKPSAIERKMMGDKLTGLKGLSQYKRDVFGMMDDVSPVAAAAFKLPEENKARLIELRKLKAQLDPLFQVGYSEYYIPIGGKTSEETYQLNFELDKKLDARFNEESKIAKEEIEQTNKVLSSLNQESLLNFGVPITELQNVQPQNEEEKMFITNQLKKYIGAIADKNISASNYEDSKLFFDLKTNKAVEEDAVNGITDVFSSIGRGLKTGQANEIILELAKFNRAAPGMMLADTYNLDTPEARKEAAEAFAKYQKEAGEFKQSEIMLKYAEAEGFWNSLSVVLENPITGSLAIAGESLAQLLPYGVQILPQYAAVGAGVGAAFGGAPGAATGIGYALRTGMAATMFGLEYSTAIVEAMRENGVDITNPDEVEKAFQNDKIWEDGGRVGKARAIPMSLVQFFTGGLAGRVFKPSMLASRGKKFAMRATEAAIGEPITEVLEESVGQFSANVFTGKDMDSKEMLLEFAGGFGSGVSGMGSYTTNLAFNVARKSKKKSEVEIANELSNIDLMNKAGVSDKKISSWINNMYNSNKIDEEQKQVVLNNISATRKAQQDIEATNIVGMAPETFETREAIKGRLSKLYLAKDNLSKTDALKKTYKSEINEIQNEIDATLKSRKVVPVEQQTDIDNVIQPSLKSYKVITPKRSRTNVFGRKVKSEKARSMNREQILKAIRDGKTLRNSVIEVVNDKEVTNELKKELDAIQESGTAKVDVQEFTEDSGRLGKISFEEVAEESKDKDAVTQEQEPIKTMKARVDNNAEQTKEIANLQDDETIEFTADSLEDIPQDFQDRAELVGETTGTRKILGLPIGRKKTKKRYKYRATGKELKDITVSILDIINENNEEVTLIGEEVLAYNKDVVIPYHQEQIESATTEEQKKYHQDVIDRVMEDISTDEKLLGIPAEQRFAPQEEVSSDETDEEEVATLEEAPVTDTKVDVEVVYHGSPTSIYDNKLKKGTSGAIFLTPSKQYAEGYTGGTDEGTITELTITKEKKDNLFDLRNEEHIERLKQGFLNNNEDLEIEYDSEEDALSDYDNAIRSMKEAAEGREGINDWASGSQWIEAMENAGFEGAIFAERPAGFGTDEVVISYALFDKELSIDEQQVSSDETDVTKTPSVTEYKDIISRSTLPEDDIVNIADKISSKTKLTKKEQSTYDANKDDVDSMVEVLDKGTSDLATFLEQEKKAPRFRKQTQKENLAPNGKPSNLNAEQYKLVRTPAFKKWFGDWENNPENASKVVDENGEPLVVYHGTAANFDVFSKEKLGSKNWQADAAREGFFFTDNIDVADEYAYYGQQEQFAIMEEGIYNEKTITDLEKQIANERKLFIETLNKIEKEKTKKINSLLKKDKRFKGITDLLNEDESIREVIANKFFKEELSEFNSEQKKTKSLYENKIKILKNKQAKYIEEQAIKRLNLKPKILDLFLNIKTIERIDIDLSQDPELSDILYEAKEDNKNGVNFNNTSREGNVYVTFDSNQMKLADGSNVTFDPEEPSIRKRKRTRTQETVSTEADDVVVEEMNQMAEAEINFTEPVASDPNFTVNPIELGEKFGDISPQTLKKLGIKDVSELIKSIEDFNNVPTLPIMSDTLATGKAVDSEGKPMDVQGGMFFNLKGEPNKVAPNVDLAWAGVAKEGETGSAQSMIDLATDMYNNNKSYWDNWWKENPEYDGLIPAVVMRMADTAINSNEAILRYALPKIKKAPSKNRRESFAVLNERLRNLPAKSFKEEVRNQIIAYLDKNKKVKTLDGFFEVMIKDAKARAEDNKKGIPLNIRAVIMGEMFTDAVTPNNERVKALFDNEEDRKIFSLQQVGEAIGEPSMLQTPANHAVAVMGIDVKNPKVLKAKHNNYGYGPKGRVIALLDNPRHGIDVFPEWKAKAPRIFKKAISGKFPSEKQVAGQTGSTFFGDAAFRMSRPRFKEMSDMDVLIGKLRFAFPSVSVSNTTQEFETAMQEEGVRKYKSDETDILGLTKDGRIILNPSKESLATPIHEFGHVWIDYLRSDASGTKGKKLLKQGLDLVDDESNPYYQNAMNEYGEFDSEGNLTNKDLVLEEALVEAIATKGESFINSAKESKFLSWMNALFKYIKDKFKTFKDVKVKDIQSMSLEDFINVSLATLLSGKAVDTEFSPKESPQAARARKLINKDDSAATIIRKARQANFEDRFIAAYLRKEKGMKTPEIKEAMASVDVKEKALGVLALFNYNEVPAAFGNIIGGMVEGQRVFEEIGQKLLDYTYPMRKTGRWKGKRVTKPQYDIDNIRMMAQKLLEETKEFKEVDMQVQNQLRVALNDAFAINESKLINVEMREVKRLIRNRQDAKKRREAVENIQKIKTRVRNFLRSNLPRTKYTTAEVNKLLREITRADEKTLIEVMDNIENFIIKKEVEIIKGKFNKLKDTKYEKGKPNEYVKGILPERTMETLQYLQNKEVIRPIPSYTKETKEAVLKNYYAELEKHVSDLEKDILKLEQDISDETDTEKKNNLIKKLEDVNIALLYTVSQLQDDTDISTLDNLTDAYDKLKNIIDEGRDEFKGIIQAQTRYYNALKSLAFEAISGFKVDFNSEKEVKNIDRELEERLNQKENKYNNRKRDKVLKVAFNALSYIENISTLRVEAIEGLLDRIQQTPGEMFGGVLQDLIYDRNQTSNDTYLTGYKDTNTSLESKAKEIFGNNFLNEMLGNAVANVDIITNRKKYDEVSKKLYKKDITPKERRELTSERDKYYKKYSQNQMYYLYNQAKDPANIAGLEAKGGWGENTTDILKQMEEKLKPNVKRWADWQVQEFFPSVWERYNAPYKKIYRTNMGHSLNYAGRIVRQGEEQDVSMLDMTSNQYRTAIGGSSYKSRITNKKEILTLDGDRMLNNYVDDMEYFRAYAETVRDINKIFQNPQIKKSIEISSGKDTYKVLTQILEGIYNRNVTKGTNQAFDNILGGFQQAFIVSKLGGFNPVIMAKQFTSALAFSDYIGWGKWTQIAAKEYGKELSEGKVGRWSKTWKEMYDNSIYLQDRYDEKDFARTMEGYNRARKSEELLGNLKNLPTKKLIGKDLDYLSTLNFVMYMVKAGDKGGVMGAIPNYIYYKDQYKKKFPKATEQQAMDYATKKTNKEIATTQQDKNTLNKDWMQTRGASTLKLFGSFLSSVKSLFRKEIIGTRNIYRKIYKQDKTAGRGSLSDNVRMVLTYHVAIPMFFQYVALGIPNLLGLGLRKQRDDDWEELLTAGVLGNINSLLLIGQAFTIVRDVYLNKPWAGEVKNIPSLIILESLGKNLKRASRTQDEEKKQKYLNMFYIGLLELSGLPISSTNKFLNNVSKIPSAVSDKEFGEAMLRLLNYGEYTIKGPKK